MDAVGALFNKNVVQAIGQGTTQSRYDPQQQRRRWMGRSQQFGAGHGSGIGGHGHQWRLFSHRGRTMRRVGSLQRCELGTRRLLEAPRCGASIELRRIMDADSTVGHYWRAVSALQCTGGRSHDVFVLGSYLLCVCFWPVGWPVACSCWLAFLFYFLPEGYCLSLYHYLRDKAKQASVQ
jgi:hypothetical protein